MNKKSLLAAAAMAFLAIAASCNKITTDPDPDPTPDPDPDPVPEQTVSGNVSGIWEAGKTVNVSGHIVVPAGESLTIEKGVTVIFSDAGVGVNHAAIEFSVDGNLYCLGTEEAPVRLTVAENLRTSANTFAGLWGGIVAGADCEEMGYYTAGDDAYPQITTNNPDGNYVITNSIIRNGWSDGIYMMGGNAIIAHNIFSATGYDGAEAVNVKSGCKVDVAGNIMFSPNTNGLKLSSSDQSEVRHQALIQAYNNTIINSGWRRDGEKGGGIYVEEMANVSVFNNLLVNCKFKAITPAWDEPGSEDCYDGEHSMIDYNYYASGNTESSIIWEGDYEDDGEILYYSGARYAYEGYAYEHEEYDPSADTHSIVATTSEEAVALDPMFVNYSLDSDPASYNWNDSWDFHVQAGSPVLEGAYTPSDASRQPFFAAAGLTVNGNTYTSPAVQPWFGAYGAE